MHYTLKDMARLADLNERTVLRYMQRTGRLPAKPTTEQRRWRFTEEDLEALREVKLQVEQERARAVHAEYTQSTDTRVLAERVAVLEATIARLQERFPYMFDGTSRPRQTRQDKQQPARQDTNDLLALPAPESHYSATHRVPQRVSESARALPADFVPVDNFAQAHGMRESQRSTWLESARSGRLPAHINEAGWRHTGVHGKVALVRYALDAQGRRAFWELWHTADWFRECEECIVHQHRPARTLEHGGEDEEAVNE